MLLKEILFESWFAGPALFAALYVSDYACTLAGARLFKKGAHEQLGFEGSYELTPYYQKDVDALRAVSPRFVVALLATVTLLIVLWALTQAFPFLAPAYAIGLGSLTLVQCTIHLRHARNIFLFRSMLAGEVTGRLSYSRAYVLQASAAEILTIAAVYLLLFILFGEWFFLGGVLGCVSLAGKHRALARKQQRPVPAASAAR